MDKFEAFKVGTVSSVNAAEGTARVYFPDDDGLVSYDLQVGHTFAHQNKDYAMPDVGEDVVCGFLSTGSEEGFILCSVYTKGNPPPESSVDVWARHFADGSKIRYDRSSHVLSVTIDGTKITANRENITVEAPKKITVKGGQQVDVEGGQVVNVNAGANIALAAPTISLTMGGTKMTLNGSSATIKAQKLVVEGNIECTGDVTAGGISLRNHTHTCPDGTTSAAQ